MEISDLIRLTAVVAGVSLALSAVLFVTKVVHHQLQRWRGVREAQYVGAVGEIMSSGVIPRRKIPGWADDPGFHDVVIEYIGLVNGTEAENLQRLAEGIDLRGRLITRFRKARGRVARASAIGRLARMATPAERMVFLAALRDRVPEVRIEAARGLAAIEDETAIPAIIEVLVTEEPWVAARMADRLVEYGRAAVPMIVATLRRAETLGAGAAPILIRVLGLIGDHTAGDTLSWLLAHPDASVRIAAASALGPAGDETATAALLAALGDPDWRVRARAAASLGDQADPLALEGLARATEDPAWWVRQNAAEALTMIGGGIEKLVDVLDGHDHYARDAALLQLGLSGALRSAEQMVESGDASDFQRRMVRAAGQAARDLRRAEIEAHHPADIGAA